MSGAELLFSLPGRGGAPTLVFGEADELPVAPVAPRDPRALVFRDLVTGIGDGRALVFCDEPDDVPPAVIPDVTLHVSTSLLTGLRGHITLRTAVQLQASGQITGLRGHITLRTAVRLQAGGQITGLRGFVGLRYAANTDRPLVGQVLAGSQAAQSVTAGVEARCQSALALLRGAAVRGQDAQGLVQGWLAAWQDAEQVKHGVQIVSGNALRLDSPAVRVLWQEAAPVRHEVLARAGDTLRMDAAPVAARFQEALRDRYAFATSCAQQAAFLVARVAQAGGYAAPLDQQWRGRHQEAWPPRPGTSVRPVPTVLARCYTPNPHLLFDAPWSADTHLVFICERHTAVPVARIIIPVLRTYVTVNSISLHRVDTGAELHAHGFNMSLDSDSWTWSWSASLHHDAAIHLGRDAQGDPAELAVLVNGIAFRLRLGAVSRDRRFSPTRWAVSGKGKAAILGAPYAPRMSFGNTAPRTARQLMDDVLTVNGVSLGWTVDWGLDDWLVPEGAWTFQGSYIEAINDIAAAAGGYVQPHATDAVLRVLPRYPAAPWAWDSITPDFEIPADAAEIEATEYVDKPAYNRVFVGGVGAGVFGPFTRAGTAGNVVAPQVNHALITHADAHRQRGLAELSNTGQQEHITLSMQVMQETGVIMPGKFLRYAGDDRVMGIVRGTSLDWRFPKLRQNIRIETHHA